MPTHIYFGTEETGLEALVKQYGDHLERLSDQQRLFILSTVALYLYGSHSFEGAMSELDPESQFLASFTSLVVRLEETGRQDLLLLVAAIATQLAWRK